MRQGFKKACIGDRIRSKQTRFVSFCVFLCLFSNCVSIFRTIFLATSIVVSNYNTHFLFSKSKGTIVHCFRDLKLNVFELTSLYKFKLLNPFY